jgi:hypothetical protein
MATMYPNPRHAAAWPALAALVLCGACGCNSSLTMPKMYAVKGKVVYKDGQPLEGGKIQFHSVVSSPVTTGGDIKDDGTFTVQSRGDATSLPGAPTGAYNVTIVPPPPLRQTEERSVQSYTPKKMYYVKGDDNNDFTIVLPWIRPSP